MIIHKALWPSSENMWDSMSDWLIFQNRCTTLPFVSQISDLFFLGIGRERNWHERLRLCKHFKSIIHTIIKLSMPKPAQTKHSQSWDRIKVQHLIKSSPSIFHREPEQRSNSALRFMRFLRIGSWIAKAISGAAKWHFEWVENPLIKYPRANTINRW